MNPIQAVEAAKTAVMLGNVVVAHDGDGGMTARCTVCTLGHLAIRRTTGSNSKARQLRRFAAKHMHEDDG